MPSSHSSPRSMMPLPHCCRRQLAEQPAPPSHSSTPVRILPSPHLASLQVVRHAPVSELPLAPVPRSHSSPGPTIPSPQPLAMHALVQLSVSTRLPSSQPSTCSGPTVLVWLSPHTLIRQCAVQSALSALAPILSHCSGPVPPGGVKL